MTFWSMWMKTVWLASGISTGAAMLALVSNLTLAAVVLVCSAIVPILWVRRADGWSFYPLGIGAALTLFFIIYLADKPPCVPLDEARNVFLREGALPEAHVECRSQAATNLIVGGLGFCVVSVTALTLVRFGGGHKRH